MIPGGSIFEKQGVDTNMNSDDKGKTPIRIAKSGNVKEVIQLLERITHGSEGKFIKIRSMN